MYEALDHQLGPPQAARSAPESLASKMETLEPSSFDAIVISSGLPEALIASALAKAGKSVLIIDSAEQYGSTWASHAGHTFPVQHNGGAPERTACEPVQPTESVSDFQRVPMFQGLTSTSQVSTYMAAGFEWSKDYILDLCPKALYQAEALVDTLVKTKAYNYLEFKLVEGSYVMRGHSRLARVAASKSDIFRDRSLSVADKRLLMRFLTACLEAQEGSGRLQGAFGDVPLMELLQQEGLSSELQDVVLHGIAMCDKPQQRQQHQHQQSSQALQQSHTNSHPHGAPSTSGHSDGMGRAEARAPPAASPATSAAACPTTAPAATPTASPAAPMSSEQGLAALQLYMHSVGRFGGQGAFMVPTYGSGSLPEAFVRHAAVNGAVTVLRYGVDSLLLHGGRCVGVVLASGQVLRCEALVGDAQSLQCLLRGSGDAAAGSLLDAGGASSAAGGAPGAAGGGAGADTPVAAGATGSTAGEEERNHHATASTSSSTSSSKRHRHGRTARAVCVLDGSIADQDSSSALLVVPPSVALACGCVLRGLQLGPGSCVAPQGQYLLYMAAYCSHVAGADPEALLAPAVQALVQTQMLQLASGDGRAGSSAPASGVGSVREPGGADVVPRSSSSSQATGEVSERLDVRPKALAVLYYMQQYADCQELCSSSTHSALPSNVACCPCADGGLVGYEAIVAATEQLFRTKFPGLPWLADATQSFDSGAAAVLDEGEEDTMADLLSALEMLAPAPTDAEGSEAVRGA